MKVGGRMKRLVIAALMLTFFALPTSAFTVTQKEAGYISISTTAEKEIAPDTASISFSVETHAKDSKTAAEKNKEITSKLLSEIKPLLALDKNDTLQTKNLSLHTDYSYEKGKKNLLGYTMNNTITVKTKDLANVSKIIDTAIENKATELSELKLYVENENEYKGELTKEATENAKNIANQTANSLGQKVAGVKNISVNWTPSYESYENVKLLTATKSSNGIDTKSTQIESGKVKIKANVYAQFYVK